MDIRTANELRDEISRLVRDHIESLEAETFGGLQEAGLRQQKERLERIRNLYADFLAALKRDAA